MKVEGDPFRTERGDAVKAALQRQPVRANSQGSGLEKPKPLWAPRGDRGQEQNIPSKGVKSQN